MSAIPPGVQKSIGEKFSMLKVVEFNRCENERSYVLAKCDCGNTKVVLLSHLRSGHTQSCGCLLANGGMRARDAIGQRFGKLVVVGLIGDTMHSKAEAACECGGSILTSLNSMCSF